MIRTIHYFTDTYQLHNAPMNYPEHPSSSLSSVNYSVSDGHNSSDVCYKGKSYSGQMIPARGLLHSGSQPNLITEELAQLLRLKKGGGRLNLNGIVEAISLSKSRFTVSSSVNSTQFTSKF